jgi:hypothetical protein
MVVCQLSSRRELIMHRFLAARAAARLASIATLILAMAVLVAPAAVAHGDDSHGKDDPELTIEVSCESVDVTSAHKISTVTIYFIDGTEETIEVDEEEYSATFEETIESAVAESHGDQVHDTSEDCTEPEAEPSADDDSPTATNDADNSDDTDGRDEPTGTTTGSNDGGGDTRSPSSTSTSSSTTGTGGTTGGATTSGTTVATTTAPSSSLPSIGATAGGGLSVGGNARVFGMALGKTCPAGPYKGMPYTNIKDCGDEVLAALLSRTGPRGLLPVTALGLLLIALGALLQGATGRRGAA